MILFKIKKRKVWHIKFLSDERGSSMCQNAGVTQRLSAEIDHEYVDAMETNEIPSDIHRSLCKACVMHAFEAGQVRIVGAGK